MVRQRPAGVDKKSNVFIILYTCFQVSPDIYGIFVTVWAFYGLFSGVRMVGRDVFTLFHAGRPDPGKSEEAGKEGDFNSCFVAGFSARFSGSTYDAGYAVGLRG